MLSLGCGSVRDCFVLSKLIGQNGEVVGVDPNEHVVSIVFYCNVTARLGSKSVFLCFFCPSVTSWIAQ